ncbi:MAG: hypothetical protein RLZZ387_1741, partial [Chloroflexota bacterium]
MSGEVRDVTPPASVTLPTRTPPIDAPPLPAYHSPTQQHSAEHRTHMADPTDNPQHEAPDPLTVG